MKVWVPETIPAELLADLPEGVAWDYLPRRGPLPPGGDEVVFLVPNYGLRQRLAEVLPALPRLKVVQTLSAGVDWIVDLIPPGVVLADARGVHDVSVAEWVISAMLALAKEAPRFAKAQQEARWIRWGEVALDELAAKTVLIVGYGSIGRALEARLRPFGVRVVRLARRARAGVFGVGSLLELLPEADVVVLLLPLTPETRGLVDERFLSRMRPGAWLINAGRGRSWTPKRWRRRSSGGTFALPSTSPTRNRCRRTTPFGARRGFCSRLTWPGRRPASCPGRWHWSGPRSGGSSRAVRFGTW